MSFQAALPTAMYKQGVIKSKTLRQLLRITWSVVCFVSGAYAIEMMALTEPAISSVVLPIYFVLVLAILYMGHLLIDAICTESPLIVTWLPEIDKTSSTEVWGKSANGAGFALATFAIALVTTAPVEFNQSRVRQTIEVHRSQATVQSPYFFVVPKV